MWKFVKIDGLMDVRYCFTQNYWIDFNETWYLDSWGSRITQATFYFKINLESEITQVKPGYAAIYYIQKSLKMKIRKHC